MAGWSCIPMDIAIKIAHHLKYHEDIELFGSVCSDWRSAAKQAKLSANVVVSYKMPWLLLPEHDDTDETFNRRRFYALFDRQLRTFDLPHPSSQPKRLLSSNGWLLLASKTETDATNLALVNPLSGATINNLPQLPSWQISIHRMILSGNPTTTLDFKVALIVNGNFRYSVAYLWSIGDDQWAPVTHNPHRLCNDIAFYRGKCYVVDDMGVIQTIGANCPGKYHYDRVVTDLREHYFFQKNASNNHTRTRITHYLVKSGDRLLAISRIKTWNKDINRYLKSVHVYDVNIENGKAVRVPNLEGVAIFVGWRSSSFSVEALVSHRYIKPNSIYFTDNYSGKSFSVYNLADEFVERYYEGSMYLREPFVWLDTSSS